MHDVATVAELNSKGRENGELLTAAEAGAFEVFVIAKNLRFRQNLSSRRIAIAELWTNHRPTLEQFFQLIAAAVSKCAGDHEIVAAPTS